jgi:hypothetical protein
MVIHRVSSSTSFCMQTQWNGRRGAGEWNRAGMARGLRLAMGPRYALYVFISPSRTITIRPLCTDTFLRTFDAYSECGVTTAIRGSCSNGYTLSPFHSSSPTPPLLPSRFTPVLPQYPTLIALKPSPSWPSPLLPLARFTILTSLCASVVISLYVSRLSISYHS